MFHFFSRLLTVFKSRQTYFAYLLILPSAAFIAGIVLYPILYTFYLSFHKMYLTQPNQIPYIGLKNYIDFINTSFFWNSIARTFYFTIVSVGSELLIGLGIALLMREKLIGIRFLKMFIIIPWAVPTVVNGIMWKWIYNANYGALNGFLKTIGIITSYQPWLARPFRAMNFVIIADIWHCTPFVALILFAALSTIPKSIYDSAKIDGASAWQCFVRITLPLLNHAILVVIIIRTMEAFRVFDIIYVMTGGGPANGTQVITYYTYLETFSYLHFGRGSALSFLVSGFILIMALIYIKLLYRKIEY